MSDTDKAETENAASDIAKAWKKMQDIQNLLYKYNKMSYSFEGNTCIIDGDEKYEYAANGTFPAGAYTSAWDEDGPNAQGQVEYYQDRFTLSIDGKYQWDYRMASSISGANATEWTKESSGEYRFTGNQTNGGIITTYELYNIDDENTVYRKIKTPLQIKKAKTQAKITRKLIK